MANVDVEVGGRSEPINKSKWWHRSTDAVQILLDCNEKGQNLSQKIAPTIYKIPSSVRNLKPKYFKPQVVSIGPLHREDKTLQEFEEQKTTYLHHLLKRLNIEPGIILKQCLQKVNDSIHTIRDCYGRVITIAQMMVMDACFIIAFLFLSEEHQPLTARNAILKHSIFHDLVLLENQIPFFVLQDIFNSTISTISNLQPDTLISGVLLHLQFLIPFKGIRNNDHAIATATAQPHHILGLLQKSFHPIPSCTLFETPNCSSAQELYEMPNHSAVELDKAGVKFKPNLKENWILAIDFNSSSFECFRWFWGHRTLRMPKMCIDDNTELFLRNIIAYEQCTPDVPDYVTSYVSAIDMLLDTKEDLSKLVNSKVITNNLGSNKDATKMLNSISKQFVFKEFYYMKQWEKLHNYHEGCWPKNIAWLKRKYFSSPWNIIALLVGIIFFALAIAQLVLRIMK